MNTPTDADRDLAIKLVRLNMDMAAEGGHRADATATKIKQAIRDHVDAETASLRDDIIRYRRALDQIGFRFAGDPQHDLVSKRVIAVLRGATFDGLVIQPHHTV
jgi:hypothetical protein